MVLVFFRLSDIIFVDVILSVGVSNFRRLLDESSEFIPFFRPFVILYFLLLLFFLFIIIRKKVTFFGSSNSHTGIRCVRQILSGTKLGNQFSAMMTKMELVFVKFT